MTYKREELIFADTKGGFDYKAYVGPDVRRGHLPPPTALHGLGKGSVAGRQRSRFKQAGKERPGQDQPPRATLEEKHSLDDYSGTRRIRSDNVGRNTVADFASVNGVERYFEGGWKASVSAKLYEFQVSNLLATLGKMRLTNNMIQYRVWCSFRPTPTQLERNTSPYAPHRQSRLTITTLPFDRQQSKSTLASVRTTRHNGICTESVAHTKVPAFSNSKGRTWMLVPRT